MKAIVMKAAGKAEVTEVSEPSLRPDYVKVCTTAVALNPTDWKHVYGLSQPGAIVGCDFSGVVEEVGSAVKSEIKKGDKVAGFVHGSNWSNHEDGSFADYLVAKDGTFLRVPESLSMADASTLGVAITTIGQGLYKSLKLPLPTEPTIDPYSLLIYGGSTAMGTMAIQYAKMSGVTVITTASPHNFDLVKSYGADVVFDYNEPDVGSKIREHTGNKLRLVFDTFSGENAQKICAEALSSDSSLDLHYSTLIPGDDKKFPRKDVQSRFTYAYIAIGEAFTKKGKDSPANPGEYEFAKMFWKMAENLFQQGKLRTHPIEEREGGLSGIPQGLEDLKENRVSGKKLVYTI
ncbi:MAG: hypothetical protein MMC23_003336 [Stictis urceolatum]|nr:hypothetical protein [Stictis urceolata]